MIRLLIALWLAGGVSTTAGADTQVLWLGESADAGRRALSATGFAVETLECNIGDAACVTGALGETGTPAYLVAGPRHTATVQRLYTAGIDRARLAGIVLLRAQRTGIAYRMPEGAAPDLLVLLEKPDPNPTVRAARDLTAALRRNGVKAWSWFLEKDMLAPSRLHPGTIMTIAQFMGRPARSENLRLLLDAAATWPNLPHGNRDFLDLETFVTTRPMNAAVKSMLEFHFRYDPHLLKQWPLETYKAFDIIAYRDEVAPGARYVTLRNRLGNMISLDLETYTDYLPEIVVGIDRETDMFQLVWYYRNNLMYSWKSDVPNISAQPLGPVMIFRRAVPADRVLPPRPLSALTLDGIAFSQTDPLAPVAAYPPSIRRVVTADNQCVYCHRIESMGGTAHHIDAHTGEVQGGFAMPLATYPEFVMRPFLYDQHAVAAKIGLTPNPVSETVVDEFFAWTKQLSE